MTFSFNFFGFGSKATAVIQESKYLRRKYKISMKQIYLKCSNYINENSKPGAYENQCYLKANLSNAENIIDSHD